MRVLRMRTCRGFLRRYERGRNHSLAISSGSKNIGKSSGSSDVKRRNGKKEKTIDELTLQTIEAGKNGKKGMKKAQVAKRRMDAHTYNATFKRLPKKVNALDHVLVTSHNDNSVEGYNNNCKGGVPEKGDDDECSQSGGEDLRQDHASEALEESNYVEERSESDVEVERYDSNEQHVSDEEALTVRDGLNDSETDCVLLSSDHAATWRSDGAGMAELDCATQKNLQPQRLDSVMNLVTGDVDIGLKMGNENLSFKRKRNYVDADPDTVASVALEDMCSKIANATASSPNNQLTYERYPHIKKPLDGKQPRWRYFYGPSQRNRKRVQHNENILKKPKDRGDNVVKKCKKVVNSIEPLSPRPLIDGEISSRNKGSLCVSYCNSSSEVPESSIADVTKGEDTNRENGVNSGASDSPQDNQPDGVGCNINQIFHFSDNVTGSDQDREFTSTVPETAPSLSMEGFSTTSRNKDHVASPENGISGMNRQNGVVFTSRDNDGANPVASQYTTGVNLLNEVVFIVNQMPRSLANITGSDQQSGEVAARVPEPVPPQFMESFSTRKSHDDSVASDRVEQQNESVSTVSTSKESDRANQVASDYVTGVHGPDGLGCINNQMLHSMENIPGSDSQSEKGTDTVQGTAPSQLMKGANTKMRNDDFVPSNNITAGVNLENGVVFTIQDSHSRELPSINSHVVQPAFTMAQSSTMPLNQALPDETSPPAITTRLSNGDASGSGEQTTLQQVGTPLADSFDCNERVTEPLVQQQFTPSVDLPSNFIVQYLPSTRERSHPCSERHISNMISRSPGLLENLAEISNQHVLQSATCLAPHLPIDAPVGGLGTPVSDIRNASITLRNSNRPVQIDASFVPQMSLSYHDPLQSEMERIHKERDQSIINHEGMKLWLKSDCDKEIEEVVAQIRKKCDVKIQEVETEFLTRKKEMDENLNKVLMNKILAEAFRSKCIDTRVSTARGSPQAGLHCGLPRMTADLAPSLPTTSIASVSPQSAAPFVQPVHLLSGTSTRPPHIISNPTLTSNLQGVYQIRARAPHLRPFRPSSSLSATSVSPLRCGMPSQPELSSSFAASSLLPQQPTKWQPPAPPTYQSGPYNRVHQPDTARGLPAPPDSSLSGLTSLVDVMNPTAVNPCPPNYASPALEFSKLDLPEFGGPVRGKQANTSHSSGPSDIVSISDDDL